MLRKTGLLLLALLALLVAAMAIFLIPAHWQIRQVEPPLPDAAAIARALPDTRSGPELSYINTATQDGPFGKLGHVGVLLSWADGRSFLIDTGMPPAQAVAFGAPMEQLLGAGPTDTFGAIDKQLGDTVQAITGIAFTHLHSDHTDGVVGVCAAQTTPATVYQTVQQRELQNFGTGFGEENIVSSACSRSVLGDATVKPVDDYPGLLAIAAGGHTPGSTIFAVRGEDRIWIFAGDITNDMRSLHNNLDKPWLYTTFVVPENPDRQLNLRRWLAELDALENFQVLVAHDIDAWERSDIPSWQQRRDAH